MALTPKNSQGNNNMHIQSVETEIQAPSSRRLPPGMSSINSPSPSQSPKNTSDSVTIEDNFLLNLFR